MTNIIVFYIVKCLYIFQVLLDPMNDDAVPTHALPRNRHDEFVRMAAGGSNIKIPGWTLPPGGQVSINLIFAMPRANKYYQGSDRSVRSERLKL